MVQQTKDTTSQRLGLSLSQLQPGPAEIGIAPNTPKTPADEGKEFFLSERLEGEQPIRVYELRLDPDGGPNKQRSASWPSLLLGVSTYSRPCSTSVSHLPICLTSCASLWTRGHLLQKMAYLEQTSLSTVALSSGTGSRNESEHA